MPQTSQRKQKYNLFKRWFIGSIYNRIAHKILFDDSSIGSEEEGNANFFALNLLQTMNNRYIDWAPTYAPHSYAVLNATTDYSDLFFYYIFEWRRQHFPILQKKYGTIRNINLELIILAGIIQERLPWSNNYWYFFTHLAQMDLILTTRKSELDSEFLMEMFRFLLIDALEP
jgi:hypothetical protein